MQFVTSIFWVTTFLLTSSEGESKKIHVRLTKMICEASNKTVLQNVSCRIRTNKRQSLLTIRATFLRKVKNAKVTFSSYRKYVDGFQRIIHVTNIEACNIIRNIENAPLPFIQDFFDQIKSSAKGNYLRVCDTIGEINMINATFDNFPMLNVLPSGEYLSNFFIFDELDNKIGNVSAISIISK